MGTWDMCPCGYKFITLALYIIIMCILCIKERLESLTNLSASVIASFYQYRGVKDNKISPPQIYICLINSVAICFNELVNFIFFRKKCYMIYFILEICIL